MTPEQLAARVLADVFRIKISNYATGKPDLWLPEADALAAIALHLAPGDELVERLLAEKSVISTTRTFPSGDQRDMVLVPNYGPNSLATEAAARIAALTATVAEFQRPENKPHMTRLWQQVVDDNATLRDRLARMEGALKEIERIVPNHPAGEIARAALTDGGSNG